MNNHGKTERKKVEELLKTVIHIESVPSDPRLPNTWYAITEVLLAEGKHYYADTFIGRPLINSK